MKVLHACVCRVQGTISVQYCIIPHLIFETETLIEPDDPMFARLAGQQAPGNTISHLSPDVGVTHA